MLKSLAVASALGIGAFIPGMVRADTEPARPTDQLTLSPTYYLDEATPAPTPPPPPKTTLNALCEKCRPLKPLQDNGFDFGGLIEGGATYNTDGGEPDFIPGRVFDVDNNRFVLNQIMLYGQRVVGPSKDKFDIGGRVEIMYGRDARFIHGNGLDFYGTGGPQLKPNEQFDLTQAYLQFNVPIGNGLVVKAGKFVTLLGYEVINPTGDLLYSHTYLFGFAIPFTHTGVLATYGINDKLTVTGGITRGWDQATDDNNGAIDGTAQVSWIATDKLSLSLTGITGPEATDNNKDYRTVIDLCATYALADNITLGFNGDWGGEPNAAADGSYATWHGAVGYASYKFDSHATVNGRIEYFNDGDGARGIGSEVWAATLGVALTPFPDNRIAQTLKFRPEVRYDWSPDKLFGAGNENDQFTVGIDAIWSF